MNWRSGLFRLWLVLSVLWVLVVGYIKWADTGTVYATTKTGEPVFAVPTEFLQLFDVSTPGSEEWRPHWPRRVFAMGVIVAPPFALLALGHILGWIGRGFRSKP